MLIPVRGGRDLLVCNYRSVFDTHWSATICNTLNNLFQTESLQSGGEEVTFLMGVCLVFQIPLIFRFSTFSAPDPMGIEPAGPWREESVILLAARMN